MSRSIPMVARATLIAIAIALEVVVGYFLITSPPANMAAMFASIGGISCFALHVLASALLAAGAGGFLPGGSVSDRASIVVLYFMVALVLPGAGIAGVALLGAILLRGGKAAAGESEFKVGNPLLENLASGGNAPGEPHLEPLAASLRSFDTGQVRRAVLALRGRAGRRDVASFLKRFKGDADSELQFYAGSALDGAVERTEARASQLALRIEEKSDDPLAHAWIAEGLIDAAAGSTERRRLAQAAAEHLEIARASRPTSWRLARLAARAHLLADDPESARAMLGDEPGAIPEFLEILFAERRWDELRAVAESGVEMKSEFREALAFWAGEGKGGAAA